MPVLGKGSRARFREGGCRLFACDTCASVLTNDIPDCKGLDKDDGARWRDETRLAGDSGLLLDDEGSEDKGRLELALDDLDSISTWPDNEKTMASASCETMLNHKDI